VTTDVAVGDAEVPFIVVAPAAGDTQVTLTAHRPDGTSAEVALTAGVLEPIEGSSDKQQRWTASVPVTYSAAGRWVLHYTITGTGEGAEDYEVYVVPSPVAGGPTWAPGRSRVANYVPHRTLARSVSSIVTSQDTYALTFDGTTRPTGLMVDRLIADGVAWVTSRVYPMNTRVQQAASVVVALYVAAAVERGWPNDDSSLQRANDLEKRLDGLMADLLTANADANDFDNNTGDYALEIYPVWSFPGSCSPPRVSTSDATIAELLARIAALEAAAQPPASGNAFTYNAGLVVADDSFGGLSYSGGILTVDDTTPGVTYASNVLTVTTA
jgi:hypothetical protein